MSLPAQSGPVQLVLLLTVLMATALAPLNMMAWTLWVRLKVSVDAISMLPAVLRLAVVAIDSGAVSLSV